MRSPFLILPLLVFTSCKNDDGQPVPEMRTISYSREIRPLLINNCLQCHQNLPLHDPKSWDLLHPHPSQEVPEIIREWVEAGSTVDEHWALGPIRKIGLASLDDFMGFAGEPVTESREVPPSLFFGSPEEALAGDLLPTPESIVSTGYLRQGEDTPTFRATKVAHEFLGLRLECAECHDHPHEEITTQDYQNFVRIFTHPFDSQQSAEGLHPPLHIALDQADKDLLVEMEEKYTDFLREPEIDQTAYEEWLGSEDGIPPVNGLLAAYAFENGQLTNLAPGSTVKEGGENLMAGNGVHGNGLSFDGTSRLELYDLGIENETSPFTISAWIKPGIEALGETTLVQLGSAERGFHLRIVGSKLQARWTRAWPENAISTISDIPVLIPNRWAHLAVTSDGSRRSKELRIYLNGRLIDQTPSNSKLMKSVIQATTPMVFTGAGISLDEVQIYGETLTEIEITQLFDGASLSRAFSEKADLSEYFAKRISNTALDRTKIQELLRQIIDVENSAPEFMVMQPSPPALPKPGESSSSILAAGDRLEFSKKINRNLLARSLANEVWRAHFGTPLVHDFGFGGTMPSQAELLEWLAEKLVGFNYSPDSLARLIQESQLWHRAWPENVPQAAKCPRVTTVSAE